MIKLEDRIKAWATVGNILKNIGDKEQSFVFSQAQAENAWFTESSVAEALQGVVRYLDEEKLRTWTQGLPEVNHKPIEVGVVMAGNIPLVGFHDMLTVLISGHKLLAKLSSKDTFLVRYVAGLLQEIEPRFGQYIHFAERLNAAQAMIATGSDNTARYFAYYFAKVPYIIRRNRSSCAILTGEETTEALQALGRDIFLYFGLGCRNVSKLYVPQDYYFSPLLDALSSYEKVLHHHKYNNNYDYNKSIYLVNSEPHYDTGFLLLRKSEALVSPISVLYYEEYGSRATLDAMIAAQHEKIQCIVSEDGNYPGSYPLGKAQEPELWDYADGVDTLRFVSQL